MEDTEYEEIGENEEIISRGIETQTWNDESDVEGEVDLEAKLISSLEEIEKCRRRNKYLKEQLSKYKEERKSKEEEVKTLQEELHNSRQQMLVSKEEVESLKQKVVEFKEDVRKLKDQLTVSEKFKESTEALNKILRLQRFPRDKIGLRYDQ